MEAGFEDRSGTFALPYNLLDDYLLHPSSLVQRQFHRLIEMLIVKHLDFGDFKAVRAYRLQVKERLYKFNYVRLSSDQYWFCQWSNAFKGNTGSNG